FGNGPYANLFDQEETQREDEPSVGLTIFDLAELAKGPLRTIVTLILIADIERQFNLPQNAGRRGCLIIEEAGVNLSGASEALENYIKDAFARFAKRHITCGAITNQIAHYVELSACKAAWNTSATNIILPVVQEGERKRLSELTHDDYITELAKSLDKRPGEFSEFLWLGDDVRGSVAYVPTGHDYWLAANHAGDTEPLAYAKEAFGSWQSAVDCLAEIAPMGFRDAHGTMRVPNQEERTAINQWRGS
ncbi:MAG: hypothetical protein VKK63_11690, partial [Synechococcus sp.]|nr:hypothetical protein [Synechococcus sp.]